MELHEWTVQTVDSLLSRMIRYAQKETGEDRTMKRWVRFGTAAAFTALAEAAHREIPRRTEARLLARRDELDQSSHEVNSK